MPNQNLRICCGALGDLGDQVPSWIGKVGPTIQAFQCVTGVKLSTEMGCVGGGSVVQKLRREEGDDVGYFLGIRIPCDMCYWRDGMGV